MRPHLREFLDLRYATLRCAPAGNVADKTTRQKGAPFQGSIGLVQKSEKTVGTLKYLTDQSPSSPEIGQRV